MTLRTAASAREALDGARTAIAAGGSESPRLDAELLLADALGVARERLVRDPELPVAGAAVRLLQSHVRRRAVEREPVAYILGRRHFRRLELRVDRRVLIPRPETELLVEVGLELAPGARVLDCCTGCGAVALALKDERPDLRLTGSDVSAEALDVARANGERLGLAVDWVEASLLDGLEDRFDAILANPPYVPSGVLPGLAPEIARHEPAIALDGGPDGLELVRALSAQALATRAGLLAFELGHGQAPRVAALWSGAGIVELRRDLAGTERVILLRR